MIRDVVVVGAGPRGLTAALGLARAGLSVEVLDVGRPDRLAWTAVHHRSVLPGLEALGVLDELIEHGSTAAGWGLRVLATGEHLTYDLGELRGQLAHPFNLRVDDTDLTAVLTRHLLALPGTGITSARLRSLTEHADGVVLEVDGGSEPLRGRWVVAADGTSSVVRREAGIAFEGTTGRERSVTALVEHDFAADGYPDTTFQVDGRLGAVVERAGATTWRYVFQEPLTRPEEQVTGRIHAALREVTGRRPRLLDRFVERTHQRNAATYRSGRVVLVGEAAHVTHRMLGHSSIAGWFDVLSLPAPLARALGGAGGSALDSWADARRRVYLDEAVPASLSRKHLLTQIDDPARLAVELDEFRRAQTDAGVRRDVLLRGQELAGPPAPSLSEPTTRSPA